LWRDLRSRGVRRKSVVQTGAAIGAGRIRAKTSRAGREVVVSRQLHARDAPTRRGVRLLPAHLPGVSRKPPNIRVKWCGGLSPPSAPRRPPAGARSSPPCPLGPGGDSLRGEAGLLARRGCPEMFFTVSQVFHQCMYSRRPIRNPKSILSFLFCSAATVPAPGPVPAARAALRRASAGRGAGRLRPLVDRAVRSDHFGRADARLAIASAMSAGPRSRRPWPPAPRG